LAEAGYPDGQGFPEVELWYKTYEEALPLTAQMIQAMLKENLNIDIKLRPTEKKVFDASFAEGQVDFGIQNWEYDYVDPSNFLNVWNPALGRHKDWNNAEFNKLTNEAAGIPIRRSGSRCTRMPTASSARTWAVLSCITGAMPRCGSLTFRASDRRAGQHARALL